MDTPAAQWPPKEMVMKSIEEIVNCSNPTSERKIRPQKEQSFNCPRCKSTNTKFCYYNNYSLSQPRYFCKTCRRYWTEGRNILVGGDSRKKNRPSTSSSSSSSISVTPRETSGAKDAGEGLGEPPDGGREWYEGEKTELESVDHSKEEDVFVDAKEHIPAVDLMSG